jgi:rhodanese-related sulfurtransferase
MNEPGFYASGMRNLTPRQAYELCKQGAVILDVREDYLNTFKQFNVERVIQIPKSKILQFLDNVPREILIIVADSVGNFSGDVYKILENNGFTNLANLAGGIVDWEKDELPIDLNKRERLSGSCMCQLKPREK